MPLWNGTTLEEESISGRKFKGFHMLKIKAAKINVQPKFFIFKKHLFL